MLDQSAGWFESNQNEVDEPTYVDSLTLISNVQSNRVYQRSNKFSVSMDEVTKIVDSVGRYGKITAEEIATKTPTILTVSEVPDRAIAIANGWDTQRFIFVMVTKTRRADGSVFASYIEGYTDHADVSHGGLIDPSTSMFINNIVNIIETVNPRMRTTTHRWHSMYSLVYDRFAAGQRSFVKAKDTMRLMRPTDTLLELHTSERYGEDNYIDTPNTRHSNIVNTSKANNKLVAAQLSSILTSAYTVNQNTSYADEDGPYLGAAMMVSEDSLTDTPFMDLLSESYGQNVGSFTYGRLLEIDPRVDDQVDIKWVNNPGMDNSLDDMGITAPETRIAAIIADVASGLLGQVMLTTISFTVARGEYGHDYYFTPLNYNSIIPTVGEKSVGIFEQRFMLFCLPQITQNGLVDIDVMCTIDLLGDSTIGVSVNGGQPLRTVVPTYCDSLFSPVIGDNEALSNQVSGYQGLIELLR